MRSFFIVSVILRLIFLLLVQLLFQALDIQIVAAQGLPNVPAATVVVGPAIPPSVPAIQEVNGVFILPELPATTSVATTPRARGREVPSVVNNNPPAFSLPPPPALPPLPPTLASPPPLPPRQTQATPPPAPVVASVPPPPPSSTASLPTDRAVQVGFAGFTGLAVRASVCVMGPTGRASGKHGRTRRRRMTETRCVSWIPFGQEIVGLAYPREWGQNPTVRIVGGTAQEDNIYSWTGPLSQSRVNAILIERITQRRHVRCDRAGICG